MGFEMNECAHFNLAPAIFLVKLMIHRGKAVYVSNVSINSDQSVRNY